MKYLPTLTALCLAQVAAGQWQLSSYLPDQPTDLFAVNADTVVIADDGGRLVRTFDGGSTWSAFQTPFVNSWFLAVDFPSPSVGYACGGTAFGEHKVCIVKTTDGGVSWDSLTANGYAGYEFRDIHFVDDTTGFVAGDVFTGLMRTTDGGNSFVPIGSVLPPVQTIAFIDDQVGFVSTWDYQGGGTAVATIQRTADQGATWEPVYTDAQSNITGLCHRRINTIQFVDAQNGFAVGGNGTFLRTIDGGLSWTASTIAPGSSDLTALWFTSPLVGYINNAGTISRTDDGGASWTIQAMLPAALAHKVVMVNENTGYMISTTEVYKTGNGGANAISEHPYGQGLTVYPDPVSDHLYIRGVDRSTSDRIEVMNMIGDIVLVVDGNTDQIDVQTLPAGMYALIIRSRNGTAMKNFMVTRIGN